MKLPKILKLNREELVVPVANPTRVIPYVVKRSQQLYELREMEVAGGNVIRDTLIRADIGPMVYAKLFERLSKQGFEK